ncbi:ABC transporter ATP-binding protein [Nocardia altamirensis]|uniref:ABC transporter ATP-binding protein n=1 Tax=Nocardia altamirensis TaxID=472158 RepID=UPI00083FF560|nr:ABC transporter ATP-binding protein [Nocardia altamirensis]
MGGVGVRTRTEQAEDDTVGPGWIRRLWAESRTHTRTLTGLGVAVLGGAVVEIAGPLLIKRAVDAAGIGETSVIGVVACLLLLLAVARFGMGFGRRLLAGKLSLDVQHALRIDLLGSLQRLDGAGQDTIRTGQVVSRSITDLQLVQGLLALVPLSGMAVLEFFLAAVVMMWLSPPLAAVALLVVPGIALVVYRIRPRLYAATWSAQQRAAEVAQHVEETVTGVRVVKGFGQEARMVDVLEQHSRLLYAERMRAVGIDARLAPTVAAIPQLGMVGVIVIGGLLALHGSIGIGTFLAFAAYVATMTATARIMSGALVMAQLTRAAADRVYQVIDTAPVVTDPPEPVELPSGPLGIEIDSLTFGFDPEQPVLRELDLTVRPGETVAIIGPAGSGKTTLSLLLPRFYAPDSGHIRLFGAESATGAPGSPAPAHADTPPDRVDIADLRATDLRGAIGVVFDDPFLFSDTIAANIALSRPDATDAEIRAAAEAAAAHEFIAELPDGYDTVVGERGLTLSGGQRQRIALARVLLAKPRILVLDDATSAVDAITEAAIFDTLPDYTAFESGPADTTGTPPISKRTTLILAHRESTLAHADRVIRLPAPIGKHATVSHASAALPMSAHQGGGPSTARAAADLSETPQLRETIEQLPPATETPRLDEQRLRLPDPAFRLTRLLRPVRWLVLATIAVLLLDAVLGVAFPPIVRYAIDTGVGHTDAGALGLAAVLGCLLVAAGWVVGAAATLITARTGERALYSLRIRSYAHLQRLGLDYYERELSGRIMTRMTTDLDSLSTFLQTGLATALIGLLTFAGIAVALLVIDVSLALVVLATLPPLAVATVVFRRFSSTAYTVSREQVSTVNADFQENVTGLRAVQANRHEPVAARRFAEYSDRYRHSRLRAQWSVALFFPFIMAWSDVALAAVIFVGAREVAAGTTTAGTLVAFTLYLSLLFAPVLQLSQVFDGYQQARVGLRRIGELLRTPSSIAADATSARPIEHTLRGEIAIDNVRFHYPGSTIQALDGVTLRVPAGSTLALVGPTGAGKSTIVKLLARLYDLPQDETGTIRVDDVDLRDYRLTDYRSRLGIVPQEAHLFSGDVASNIAFGKPTATAADIAEAAAAVGATAMIAALPLGMGQPVGERGRGLSAGQRQLIALARAELVRPDLLLLDEATATLDPDAEAAVLAASRSLTHGRTTVLVAHRLGTAARADQIAVIDHGRVAEIGTHTELLAAGGPYTRLWSAARETEGIFLVTDKSSFTR